MAVVNNLDSILQFVAQKLGAMEYHAGDSASGTWMCFGHITAAGKTIDITVPLGKLTTAVSSVSISTITAGLRTASGGYVGGSETYDVKPYLVSANITQGGLRIRLTNDSGFGGTNNTPVNGRVVITGTFA